MTDEKTVNETPGDGESGQETEVREVPLSVLQTVEGKFKESQAELEALKLKAEADAREAANLRQQLELHRANPSYGQPPPQPTQTEFGDLDDDDLVTGKQFKQYLSQPKNETPNQELQSVRKEMQDLRLAMTDPNYIQTINTYLPKAIQKYPQLETDIRNSQDPKGTALRIALMQKQSEEAQPAPENPEPTFMDTLNQIMQNNNAPKSPSTVSGGGVVTNANKWADMDDDKFRQHVENVKAGRT